MGGFLATGRVRGEADTSEACPDATPPQHELTLCVCIVCTVRRADQRAENQTNTSASPRLIQSKARRKPPPFVAAAHRRLPPSAALTRAPPAHAHSNEMSKASSCRSFIADTSAADIPGRSEPRHLFARERHAAARLISGATTSKPGFFRIPHIADRSIACPLAPRGVGSALCAQ